MPEWLQSSLANGGDPSPGILFWRIGIATILGAAVAGIYRWSRRGEPVQASFMTTLVLLAAVIAMATQVIGDNVARAFSLVGALSVVRFRTVVKDTQDTAFVILAVVVGMAAGANHLVVALTGLSIVALAALLMWPHRNPGGWQSTESTLAIKIAVATNVREVAEQILSASTARSTLIAISTARRGASLDLVYRVRLRAECAPSTLVTELNRLEGVESVELSRDK
jgi:hypothetical protein